MKKQKGYRIIKQQEVKSYSKGEYVRLGNKLRAFNAISEIPIEDLEMLQTFRISYKEPLSQVFDILRKSIIEVDNNAIVTYRVKRIESIISKLKRLEKTQLPRIEDIAGCRCILRSNEQVYKLKNILNDYLHIKSDRNDYIENPKPDGYKSLHLIVQTKDQKSNPIEVQLRCEKDHNWATLVEITDQIYDTKIKELGNEKELGRILYLLSIGINSLEKKELKELINLIEQKKFLEKISSPFFNNSIKVRQQWSKISKRKGDDFYLIQVDQSNNSKISSFNNFFNAEKNYFQEYQKNPTNNIVLTHIPNAKFDQIAKAYSNYTLTFHDFIDDFSTKLLELVRSAFEENKIREFLNYYSMFVILFFETAKLQLYEQYTIKSTNCLHNKRFEWQNDLSVRVKKIVDKRDGLFSNIKINKLNISHYIIGYNMKKIWEKHAKDFINDVTKTINPANAGF